MKRGAGSASILLFVILMFSFNILLFGWSNDFVNKITGKSTNEIDSNTKLLLHMDDVGLTDEIGHSVTLNGNAARSSAQSKFGSYSAYFDGNGDYLSVPDSDDWNFGSSDFTIDFWMYLNSKSGVNVLVSHGGSGAITNTNGWTLMFTTDGTVLQLLSSSGNPILVSWSPSINTWYHVAVVRNGNTFTAYVNGNAIQTNTFSNSMADSTSLLIVGKAFDDGRYFNGYIDELRISKGVARWTSNFQPPTSAYSSSSCTPNCAGKQCGSDGCEGTCGTCGNNYQCNQNNLCELIANQTTMTNTSATSSTTTSTQNTSSTSQSSTAASTNATASTQTSTATSDSSSQTGIITQEGVCQGCEYEERCLPIGTRLSINSENSFCSIEQKFEIQKSEGIECSNNYECLTNQCSSSKCVDISKELNVLNKIMNDIWGFLKGVFGGD